ncbi:hypothetical protein KC844_18605, partial [Proteus mirabilis]|uniref:hypothetical protein n=2 Tax=Proteus mirabilis TaxID=584 RepID=UPI003314A867
IIVILLLRFLKVFSLKQRILNWKTKVNVFFQIFLLNEALVGYLSEKIFCLVFIDFVRVLLF